MQEFRTVRKLSGGKQAVDGAGVKLVRVFGYHDTADYDPFLMLDAFDSLNPNDYIKGFPQHPHRGIETITYLISGNIEHKDSLGNHGIIGDGDCQWMTAGSGILHEEMPQASKRMLGAQLWLNLPASDKMTAPKYGDIRCEQMPVVTEENTSIHVIAGQYRDIKGAFEGRHVRATYLDVELAAQSQWTFQSNADDTLFVYIFEGQLCFEPQGDHFIEEKQAVLFHPGQKLWVKAGKTPARFLLLTAKPLGEPIAWGGPIVMNTKEELNLAFNELNQNTFIK